MGVTRSAVTPFPPRPFGRLRTGARPGVPVRPVALALTLLGIALAVAMQTVMREKHAIYAAHDTWAYWVVDPANPYSGAIAPAKGAFLYSPAIAQLLAPLSLLPWEAVRDGWAVLQVALLALIAGPFSGPLALVEPVREELMLGNISLVLAAVAAVGVRWPAVWSIAILAKVTPGIGLVWFVARREWRNLGIALGVTGAVVAVSYAIAPHLWLEWAGILVANVGVTSNLGWVPPRALRVIAAIALIWWGARTDRPWVVPLAVTLSMGHLWMSTFAIAVGAAWWINPLRPRSFLARTRQAIAT